jgi:hypothetical protein
LCEYFFLLKAVNLLGENRYFNYFDCPFFKELPLVVREMMQKKCTKLTFKFNDILFKERFQTTDVYFLAEGEIDIIKRVNKYNSIKVKKLQAKTFLGMEDFGLPSQEECRIEMERLDKDRILSKATGKKPESLSAMYLISSKEKYLFGASVASLSCIAYKMKLEDFKKVVEFTG